MCDGYMRLFYLHVVGKGGGGKGFWLGSTSRLLSVVLC